SCRRPPPSPRRAVRLRLPKEMPRGLLARAIQFGARRLPPRARRAGARLLSNAPIPQSLRRRLRAAARGGEAALPAGARGHAASAEDPAYAAWVAQNALTAEAAARAAERVERFRRRPLISVLLPVHDPDPEVLGRALRSVEEQIYPDWELCIVDDASRDPAVVERLESIAADRPGRARLRRLDD